MSGLVLLMGQLSEVWGIVVWGEVFSDFSAVCKWMSGRGNCYRGGGIHWLSFIEIVRGECLLSTLRNFYSQADPTWLILYRLCQALFKTSLRRLKVHQAAQAKDNFSASFILTLMIVLLQSTREPLSILFRTKRNTIEIENTISITGPSICRSHV